MSEWTVEIARHFLKIHPEQIYEHDFFRCKDCSEAYGFLQGHAAAEKKYKAVVEAAEKVVAHYCVVHDSRTAATGLPKTAGQILLDRLQEALIDVRKRGEP